jgi:hypothetical protein
LIHIHLSLPKVICPIRQVSISKYNYFFVKVWLTTVQYQCVFYLFWDHKGTRVLRTPFMLGLCWKKEFTGCFFNLSFHNYLYQWHNIHHYGSFDQH